eukprot:8941259-Alexandrium_andersonii.AAC.1
MWTDPGSLPRPVVSPRLRAVPQVRLRIHGPTLGLHGIVGAGLGVRGLRGSLSTQSTFARGL